MAHRLSQSETVLFLAVGFLNRTLSSLGGLSKYLDTRLNAQASRADNSPV